MKKIIITIVIILVGGGVLYYLLKMPVSRVASPNNENNPAMNTETPDDTGATTTPAMTAEGSEMVIGKSVQGLDIIAYNYGMGDTRILFVGGIHGGYSWNTALVAFQLMDYLKANPSAIPANIKVTVIPVLNPDGLNKVVGTSTRFAAADVNPSQAVQISGRYNGHVVDLNRNFACDWKTIGTWRTTQVSGGTAAFSEPETAAVKSYIESHKPSAVVVWYSAAGGVYASSCGGPISSETSVITNLYAKASGYPAYETYDFYETSGDMVNWLANIKIPAISVLLTNHTDTEWTKNLAGIKALLLHYAK